MKLFLVLLTLFTFSGMAQSDCLTALDAAAGKQLSSIFGRYRLTNAPSDKSYGKKPLFYPMSSLIDISADENNIIVVEDVNSPPHTPLSLFKFQPLVKLADNNLTLKTAGLMWNPKFHQYAKNDIYLRFEGRLLILSLQEGWHISSWVYEQDRPLRPN